MKYKVGNEKLEEQDARIAIDDSLTILKEGGDIFLKNLHSKEMEEILSEIPSGIDYESPMSKKLIEILNRKWENGIAKEREKSAKICQKGDLKSLAKEVTIGLKSLNKTLQMAAKFLDKGLTEIDSGDAKYGIELLKFVEKMFTDSAEIFTEQQNYNAQFLQKQGEADDE